MSKLATALRRSQSTISQEIDINAKQKNLIAGSSAKQKEKLSTPKKITTKVLRLGKDQLRKNRILIGSADEPAAMSYKILRTKVYQKLNENSWSSIGITSPNPSEGKTTTVINLAHAFSRSVQNPVVLVDFDFHRPNIHKTLGFSPPAGVVDYLNDDVLISEVIYQVVDTDMFVIPGRDVEKLPMDLMSSDKVSRFHNLIKGMFPSCYIFYDMPPVIPVDDAVIFEDKECNLIVTAESQTSVDDLYHAMELLSGQNILGYVLNKSKSSSRIAKYGYSYYGYGGYGSYTKKS